MEESRIDNRKAKNQKRLMVAVVVLLTIVAVIVIGINLSNDPSSASNSSKEATKINAKTFSDENFSTVLVNPKENKGARVNITGEVLKSNMKGNIWRIQIFQDQEGNDGLTVIESSVHPSAEKGDIVRVIGIVKEEEKIKNSKKATIKVPVIRASSIIDRSKP